MAYRELDETLSLTAMSAEVLTDSRQGSYKQHQLVLQREIDHLLTRPVGGPSHQPKVFYHSFQCQAKSWQQARRVVAKIDWHAGELFPRVG